MKCHTFWDDLENLSGDPKAGSERARRCVFFGDECVFQQSGSRTRTWAPRGAGTLVKSEPCRKSVKAFGAVSVEERPRFHFQFSEKFNGTSFLRFIKRIVRCNQGRKVFLILDNARYHYAKSVTDWVADNSEVIELFFLPPYSPDLNAAEHVWRLTKRTTTHNRHFATLELLHSKVFRRFNRYQGNPPSLRSAVARFMPPVRRQHARP
jgi:transposase